MNLNLQIYLLRDWLLKQKKKKSFKLNIHDFKNHCQMCKRKKEESDVKQLGIQNYMLEIKKSLISDYNCIENFSKFS